MHHNALVPLSRLKRGQLWKLKRGYVYIVGLLSSTIQFKMMDSPDDTQARTLTSGIDTLWRYLVSRKGMVIRGSKVSVS